MAKYVYETLTDADDDLELADQLNGREQEHRQYARNAAAFEAILAAMVPLGLPADWPAELVKYKDLSRDQIIAAIDDESMQTLVLNLAHRQMIKRRMQAEKHEASRIEMYMKQVKAMLPTNKADYDKVLADAKARREAKV